MAKETIATGTDHLLASLEDGVLTLTLNRPEARNAMSTEMTGKLAEQLGEAEVNSAVRCIVLTGAGKGFCAGVTLRVWRREATAPWVTAPSTAQFTISG